MNVEKVPTSRIAASSYAGLIRVSKADVRRIIIEGTAWMPGSRLLEAGHDVWLRREWGLYPPPASATSKPSGF